MKKLKKILSFCLASFMVILCMSFSVSAADNTNKNKIIYDYLCDDYCAITNMSKEDANNVFENTDINIISDVESKYIEFDSENNLEQTILYLQDNYANIVDGLSDVEKYNIDTYLLLISIKYYSDNFNWIMVENDKATVVSDEPAVSVEDALIDDSINNNISMMASGNNTNVAELVLFSDPSTNIHNYELFSDIDINVDTGVHSWIVVRNISSENIVVGKMTIAPSTEIAVGTWGNQSEHVGVWYNLEPYRVKYTNGYSGRVSTTCKLTSSKLATLSQFIRDNDSWSKGNNCSAFASKAWNKVSDTNISAGIISTPKTLGENIKKHTYKSGETMRYYYKVHYANGSGTPKESTVYTRTDTP